MTERDMLKAAFTRIGRQFFESGYVETRTHLFDDSDNFVQTTYFFKPTGELTEISTELHGCTLCCEGLYCDDNSTLYLDDAEISKRIDASQGK